MLQPIRQTVTLRAGTVTLHAWGADAVEAHTLDLLTLTATLGAMLEDWDEWTRGDVEERVWGCFWRLVNASLRGAELPRPLVWADRVTLLEAMFELNIEDSAPKLTALAGRTRNLLGRPSQGLLMTSMNS